MMIVYHAFSPHRSSRSSDDRPLVSISPKQSIIPLLVFPSGVMNVLIAADAAKRRFKMKTFKIENETNNITIHTTAQEAEAVANAERFRNEGGLAKRAANWPA